MFDSALPNIGFGQSGAPTRVINLTTFAVYNEALQNGVEVFGARFGVKGLLSGDFISLTRQDYKRMVSVAATPSSALGTARRKPESTAECDAILANLRTLGIGILILNGGNDSAESLR